MEAKLTTECLLFLKFRILGYKLKQEEIQLLKMSYAIF